MCIMYVIYSKSTFIQRIAWRRSGAKPFWKQCLYTCRPFTPARILSSTPYLDIIVMRHMAQQLAVDAERAEGALVVVDEDEALTRHGDELG